MAKLWRMQSPVMDNGRVVKGGMFRHQRAWWELENFVKALIAGYGAGKTIIGCKRGIALALQNAPSPHLDVGPSYKIAKRTIIPAYKALLAGKQSLMPDLQWRYHKTDHEFTIRHNGRTATIWVASGDDPDSLRGPNVGSARIDEPFIQEEEVLDQVLARVRDTRAKVQEITLTGTPEQLNWGYDICEGERKDDYDIGTVYASTRENKAIPHTYADRLEQAFSDKAAQAYIEGRFVNLQEGLVYYAFDPVVGVQRLPDPGHELEVGMDFNVNPMAAVVFWRNGEHMHVVREIELPNADTEYMCSYLTSQDEFLYPDGEEKGKSRIQRIYPDASGRARHSNAPGGKTDLHYIEEAGFEWYCKRANPPIRDRENAVNGKLKNRGGQCTLTIDPSCKKLKAYFLKYTHEEKNKQKQMSHLVDALGYPVSYLYPVRGHPVKVGRLQGA